MSRASLAALFLLGSCGGDAPHANPVAAPLAPTASRSSVILINYASAEVRAALCWDAARSAFVSDEGCRGLVPPAASIRSSYNPTWSLSLGNERDIECKTLDGEPAGWRAHVMRSWDPDDERTFGYGLYPEALQWNEVRETDSMLRAPTPAGDADQATLRATLGSGPYFRVFGDDVDIDGDGTNERILLQGEPSNAVVVAWAGDLARAERIPHFRVFGVVDLNGDGRLELVGPADGQDLAIAEHRHGHWEIVARSRGCFGSRQ